MIDELKDAITDLIVRAEAWHDHGLGSDPVPELIAALKAAQEARDKANREMARCYGQLLHYQAKLNTR